MAYVKVFRMINSLCPGGGYRTEVLGTGRRHLRSEGSFQGSIFILNLKPPQATPPLPNTHTHPCSFPGWCLFTVSSQFFLSLLHMPPPSKEEPLVNVQNRLQPKFLPAPMKLVAWNLILAAQLDLGCQEFLLSCLGRCWISDPPKLYGSQCLLASMLRSQIIADVSRYLWPAPVSDRRIKPELCSPFFQLRNHLPGPTQSLLFAGNNLTRGSSIL